MANFYGFYPPAGGGSNPSVGTNGITAPTSSTEVGGINPSGNLQPLLTTADGALIVDQDSGVLFDENVAQFGGNNVVTGTGNSGLGIPRVTISNDSSITNISGTISLPTGASTLAEQALQLAQETAIAGSTSSIDTKSSTIATNTGNTATSVASIDTKTPTVGQKTMAGSSPVAIASDQSSIPVTATLQAGTAIAGKFGIDQTTPGTTNAVSVTNFPATQPVSGTVSIGGPLGQSTAASSVSVTLSNEDTQDLNVTGAAAQTAVVNNILTTASGTAATDLNGYRSASVQVISTGTGGTYIFEGSNDNTNFQTIPVFQQLILTGTPITAAITASASQFVYVFPVTTRYIRLRIATTITGGSIQAISRFSQTPFEPAVRQIAQATAANLNATVAGTVTATQGTAAVVANSWYTKLSDGTTGPVKVQAASTAPAAADIALTVALSPNGTVPKQAGHSLSTAPVVTTYGTPITSAAYTTIVASTSAATNLVEIFDSSGVALYFATGAAASEVNQFIIYPGGNGQVPIAIPAGTRISYKAVSTSATGASAFNSLSMYT